MNISPKKSLAIFSLTCCEGCQFELLSFYEHFQKLLKFYDIKNFRLGQEDNLPGPFDVVLIEGTPEGESQIKTVKNIRRQSKVVIAIGACAHLGGIQSQRNRLPKKMINKDPVLPVSKFIKVDYAVPGCPVSHTELVRCLIDVYFNKEFILPDRSVCFECRLNENQCLIKNGKPCLGPVTRGGCGSICPNFGEACFGCRGPMEQSNFDKMRDILGTMLDKDEIENWLTIYGNLEQEHNRLTR